MTRRPLQTAVTVKVDRILTNSKPFYFVYAGSNLIFILVRRPRAEEVGGLCAAAGWQYKRLNLNYMKKATK